MPKAELCSLLPKYDYLIKESLVCHFGISPKNDQKMPATKLKKCNSADVKSLLTAGALIP